MGLSAAKEQPNCLNRADRINYVCDKRNDSGFAEDIQPGVVDIGFIFYNTALFPPNGYFQPSQNKKLSQISVRSCPFPLELEIRP